MTTKTPIQVRVTRRFDATPDRVFDAWLNPESIGAWMFGPAVREEEVVRIINDPRVGGSFSVVVGRQGEEIHHGGLPSLGELTRVRGVASLLTSSRRTMAAS
jgi:uncharacterized protein YndB with AHSA1/START domain